jgi:hypothetical protein
MTNLDRALDLFSKQFNCAQAILGAYGPTEGLDEKHCMMIAAPFGGGIARLGETWRRRDGRADGPWAALYDRARHFVERFKVRNRSIAWRDLLRLRHRYPRRLAEGPGAEDAPNRLPERSGMRPKYSTQHSPSRLLLPALSQSDPVNADLRPQ